ncbi:MAG: hypothetical protein QXQ46_07085 [Thermoplasmatales archaeon]
MDLRRGYRDQTGEQSRRGRERREEEVAMVSFHYDVPDVFIRGGDITVTIGFNGCDTGSEGDRIAMQCFF